MRNDLQYFVNREDELKICWALIRGEEAPRVVLLHGPLGIGKTTLVNKLRAECQSDGRTCILVDFQQEDLYSVDTLIDCLRDQIGGEFSTIIGDEILVTEQLFAAAVVSSNVLDWNGASVALRPLASGISKLEGQMGEIGANAQAAIGIGNIQIRDSQINFIPGAEPARVRQEKMRRLNQAFRRALTVWLAERSLILLFDTCDKATQDVVDWLYRQMLDPVCDDHSANYTRLTIILTGDSETRRGAWLRQLMQGDAGVVVAELPNLSPDAVKSYWQKRKLAEVTIPVAFLQLGAPPHLLFGMANLTATVPQSGSTVA